MELWQRYRKLLAFGNEQFANSLDVINSKTVRGSEGRTYVCNFDVGGIQLVEFGLQQIEPHGEFFIRGDFNQVLSTDAEPAGYGLV